MHGGGGGSFEVTFSAYAEAYRFIGSALQWIVETLSRIHITEHVNLLVFMIACSVILLVEDTIFLAYRVDWVMDDDVETDLY